MGIKISSSCSLSALKKTRTITFIVTEACQLRCTYCYLVGKNNTNKMTFDVAKRTIDYVFSEPRLNSENVVLDFIGGEPLLEIDLIGKIVEYFLDVADAMDSCWKRNYRIRITTNGLLYTSEAVQKFINKHHKHLDISISIDGDRIKTNSTRIFSNGSGSYDKVVESIPLWRSQFPQEGTKMTISRDDLPYVYDSVRHLISLNIHKIDINPVLENVWREGDDKLLEQQLVRCADYIINNHLEHVVDLSCFDQSLGMPVDSHKQLNYGVCGSFTFAVDFAGKIYTCLRFARFSLRSKRARSIGDIYSGIDWNRMRPYQSFCNQITSLKCAQCDYQNGCKVCPAENYDSSSTATLYEQSYAACQMHKAKVKSKNYFWNRLTISQS